MGLITLVAFWVVAIRLWFVDGPKIPLIFIGIWIAGFLGFPALGWDSGYQFMSLQAVLAVILVVVEKFKRAL